MECMGTGTPCSEGEEKWTKNGRSDPHIGHQVDAWLSLLAQKGCLSLGGLAGVTLELIGTMDRVQTGRKGMGLVITV